MTQTKPGTRRDRALERGIQSTELRNAFRAAKKAGWAYVMSGTTHILLTNPRGERLSISTTAKDGHAPAITALKKMGLPLE